MQSNQPQPANGPSKSGDPRLWVMWIVFALAFSLEAFNRRRFGERYIGLQAVLVVPIMLIFTMFFPNQDVTLLLFFLVAYLIFVARARVEIAINRWRGKIQVHSLYNGDSRFRNWFPRWREINLKRLEGYLAFLLGLGTLGESEPLGAYLMVASIALLGSIAVIEANDRNRAMDMNDAVIEQSHIAERFRDMQNQGAVRRRRE